LDPGALRLLLKVQFPILKEHKDTKESEGEEAEEWLASLTVEVFPMSTFFVTWCLGVEMSFLSARRLRLHSSATCYIREAGGTESGFPPFWHA